MKCKICGNESGKCPLCLACNQKKDQGLIIKCNVCNNWHYSNTVCPNESEPNKKDTYIYEMKRTLLTDCEQKFYDAIKSSVPEEYFVFPQINLAAFINKNDDSRFHNELFRNVDFLLTDSNYSPKIVIEINDQTHLTSERKERDFKVKNICEEAGIPIIKLWTSYNIDQNYIKNKIDETLAKLPVPRIIHFDLHAKNKNKNPKNSTAVNQSSSGNGCYIATCVYGDYDCPPVWVLRRYRDNKLSKTKYGRVFIRIYYLVSPWLVNKFNNNIFIKKCWFKVLDKMVRKLQEKGFDSSPYID